MKHTGNRLLAGALAVMLTFALWPAVALAAPMTRDVGTSSELSSALAAAQSGDTIRLTADITYTSQIDISGKDLTFDVNGHTLLLNVSVSSGSSALSVSSGRVDLTDTGGGTGAFNVIATGSDNSAVSAGAGGTVTVSTANGTTRGASASGGVITVLGDATGADYGVYAIGGGSITVHGNAKTTGRHYGVYATGGSTVIVEGDVTAMSANPSGGVYADGATVTVKGNISVPFITFCAGVKSYSNASVTVDGTITARAEDYIWIEGTQKSQEAGVVGAGADAGYLVYTQSGSSARVRVKIPPPTVCEIGSTGYTTLAAALAAVQSGQTIKLLDDINVTSTLTVDAKDLTFDLNSHTLDVSTTSGNGLNVQNGGKIALAGSGAFDVATSADGAFGVLASGDGSSAQVTSATASGNNGTGACAQSGGVVTVESNPIGANYVNVGGVVRSQAQKQTDEAMPGYGKYTDGTSTVWVKLATYAITVQDDGHGTGSASPASAYFGQTITLSATPADGYRLKQWQAITPSDLSIATDTFTMPDEAVTVKAVFEEIPVCQIGSTPYATLAAALAAVQDKQTIQLLQDIAHTSTVTIDNKTVTFALNGHTLAITVASGDALSVLHGGKVLVTGSGELNVKTTASSAYGVSVSGSGSSAVVTNARAEGEGSRGAHAMTGGSVTVLGNATSSGGDSCGAYTEGTGAVITVQGDAEATGPATTGAYASGASTITVHGNATAVGQIGSGVIAYDRSTVTVGGNVTATSDGSVGVYADHTSTVTIDGSITAPTYIQVGGDVKTKQAKKTVTTKSGYDTYTDNTNTVWVKKTSCDVTFNNDGVTYATASTTPGGPVANADWPADPEKTGYRFDGWFTGAGGTGTQFTASTAVSDDSTVYAKWTIKTYMVAFDCQNGGALPPDAVEYNGLLKRPVEPRWDGHAFEGWYKEAACTHVWDFATDKVTNFLVVYAKWSLVHYIIRYDLGGGTVNPANPESYTIQSAAIKLSNPSRPGYGFAGWTGTGISEPSTDITIAAGSMGDRTYTANWVVNAHTLTFQSDGAIYATGTANAGAGIGSANWPADPAKTGYTFGGWFTGDGGTGTRFTADTAVDADLTLYALWSVNTYAVSFDSQGGSAVPSILASYGATVEPPATSSRLNYTFAGWFRDAACTSAWNFATDTVAGDTVLYARWEAQAPAATLSGISLSAGALTSAFKPTVTNYTINLGENDDYVTVTPCKAYDSATMTIDGKKIATQRVSLANGKSATITIKVTLGKTSKTYKLTIKRPKSTSNTLASIQVSAGILSPAFDPATTTYTLVLPQSVAKTTITAARSSSLASVTSAKATYALKNGQTVKATVKVRSQSGATRTYTITILREKSDNANLASLKTSSKQSPLSPAFRAETTDYTITLPAKTASIKLNGKATDALSKVAFNGKIGTSAQITLKNGQSTTVTVVVTAQAGNTKAYTVVINRP